MHPLRCHSLHQPRITVQVNYQNKQLIAASLVAGWDAEEGGQVYGIPIGGTMVREQWTTDGSGSTYIWGYMDSAFKDDFSKEEAQQFVVEAVALAMSRDGSSGGIIRMHTVDKDGADYRFIQGKDVPLFGKDLPFVAAAPQGGVVVG
jgi:20S proteasome subunit beta 1